jgi:WD40 repeat protein
MIEPSPNGKYAAPTGLLLASGSLDGMVKLWDLDRGALLETLYLNAHGDSSLCSVRTLALSLQAPPTVAIVTGDKRLLLWSVGALSSKRLSPLKSCL